MAYDGKLLARARARLDLVREGNQAEHNRRLASVYSRVPEVERIDGALRRQMTELVRLTLNHAPDLAQKVEKLKKDNLDLQVRRAELLNSSGFPEDYLDDIYACKLCRDTGLYNGAPCACLEKLYNTELTKELGTLLKSSDERFESFSLDYYSGQFDPAIGIAPRECMERVLEKCKKYAAEFSCESKNLLFQGGTGLGKTFLSACIARQVAAAGFSVCYDSTVAALEAFEQQKFSRDADAAESAAVKIKRMLGCELMILDDLGTEMVTSVSLSALYTLINTRLVNHRPTIISTNCSDDELARRYSAQICSRLSGNFVKLPFVGKDIRLIKKGE